MKSIKAMALLLMLLSACLPQPAANDSPTTTSTLPPTVTTAPTAESQPEELRIEIFFPTSESEFEMGQGVKFIAQVHDSQGNLINAASMKVSVFDPAREQVATLTAVVGSKDTYRTEDWSLPHRRQQGKWTYEVTASLGNNNVTQNGSLQVNDSTSEYLLKKYGFWLDAPRLKNINPTLMGEQGDATNGLIRWGGTLTNIHVMPANWVEVHWRSGQFALETEEDVYDFLTGEVGSLGFTPVRAIGPFEQTTFRDWDAWKVGARGQYVQDHVEYLAFYAPEVDKTYAIGTTVVVPPSGMDAHAELRSSFEVDPTVETSGSAPVPFVDLLPKVEQIGPEMGAVFTGQTQPIVLSWEPLKELAEDEYYEVMVDYNYVEANPKVKYATRETTFILPTDLQEQPNCEVFNWQVTLMRQTGTDEDGRPVGEPLSYRSFYRYLIWRYPDNAQPPFDILCRNAQF